MRFLKKYTNNISQKCDEIKSLIYMTVTYKEYRLKVRQFYLIVQR